LGQLFNSLLSIVFVICATGATFIMLELRGDPKVRPINTFLIKLHKILGWIFIAIFSFLFIVMIQKLSGYNKEVSARISLHIVLAIFLVPLLAVKLIIARRYPHLSQSLITYGPAILMIAVTLSAITAGFYFISSPELKHAALTDLNIKANNIAGKSVMETKCTYCHTIDRIVQASKSEQEWERTVKVMIKRKNDPDFLTKQEQKKLIEYLVIKNYNPDQ
jgi:hypothetical protein